MLKKIAVGIGILIVLVLATAAFYFTFVVPSAGDPPDIAIELTEQRIERGEYLAHNVAVCMTCHTNRQAALFAQPEDSTMLGGGNTKAFVEEGIGILYAANLTPYNLGDWTDGEIYRAITAGVSRDGTALFPIMPYPHYATMSREDIYSIIAYLRTLEPVEQEVPDTELQFPMSLIVKTIPQDPNPQPIPPKSDTIAYGKYIVNAASCSSCHTPINNQGQPLPGMNFAGGFEFPMPTGGVVRASNITPHATGIGSWTEDTFIARFKRFNHDSVAIYSVGKNEFNTEMPWKAYAGINEEDLQAIYAYLRTVTPVENIVSRFSRGTD